ncbi:MAG: hypothetical protein K8R85_09345 [Bacteroidetes bacterium]|nr:hypothetical protein [Bacteroidota bacterium]
MKKEEKFGKAVLAIASQRQVDSSLFERLALSRDKKGVLQLSEKGHIVNHPAEVIKDPYVLDLAQGIDDNQFQRQPTIKQKRHEVY